MLPITSSKALHKTYKKAVFNFFIKLKSSRQNQKLIVIKLCLLFCVVEPLYCSTESIWALKGLSSFAICMVHNFSVEKVDFESQKTVGTHEYVAEKDQTIIETAYVTQ